MITKVNLSLCVSKAFLLQHSEQNASCKEHPTIPPIHKDSGDLLRMIINKILLRISLKILQRKYVHKTTT